MQRTLAASVNVQCHLVAKLSLDTPAWLHDEEDSGPGFQNMFCMQKISTEKSRNSGSFFFFFYQFLLIIFCTDMQRLR